MRKIRVNIKRKLSSWRTHTKKGKPVTAHKIKSKWTSYRKDLGKVGKGKPMFPRSRVKKGILGKDFFDKPLAEEKRILNRRAKRFGEKAVQGQLQFVANVNRKVNPSISHKSARLRRYVAGSFRGHKKVSYPGGFHILI